MKWVSTIAEMCPGKFKYLLLILILQNILHKNQEIAHAKEVKLVSIENITVDIPNVSKFM